MQVAELNIDRRALAEICQRYRVERLEAFGSFAAGDAAPASDLDLLVTFAPGATLGLEFFSLEEELRAMVGRPVDLITRRSVENSPNKYFRRFALRNTEVLYEQP